MLVLATLTITGPAVAGSLDPTNAPSDPTTAMFTLGDLYRRLDTGTPGVKRTGGFTEPTNAPAPTGHTLDEIMAKAPATNANAATVGDVLTNKVFWGLKSGSWGLQSGTVPNTNLSPSSAILAVGYYTATNLTQVDTDLVASNIATNVTIFGVVGVLCTTPAPVPRTGQTNSYWANDDGAYQKGVKWPSQRFDVGTGTSSNCVTDNLTGLMWLKNPDATIRTWTNAIVYCEGLDGTNGRGGHTDWRLPNVKELQSIISFGAFNPALPSGHPFVGIQSDLYWSSTTTAANSNVAWNLYLVVGYDGRANKTDKYYVWPVRGGQ